MKTLYRTFIPILLLCACNHSIGTSQSNGSAQAKSGYKYHELMDQNLGIPKIRLQIPEDWQVYNEGDYYYHGPNGMKMSSMFSSSLFTYAENDYSYQSLIMTGQQHTPPPADLNDLIQKYYMSEANRTGRVLINSYALPKVQKKYMEYANLILKTQPIQLSTQSYALEWRDNQGKSYMTILLIKINRGQNFSSWSFMNQFIESPSSKFNEAKKILMHLVETEEHNTQWLHLKNREMAQQSKAIHQAWQSRMASIKLRSSNSGYSSTSKIYDEISDISHQGYLNRSNINDAGRTSTVNMIHEQNIISNPATNESYVVPAGSNNYWVNNNAKFIGVDDPNFDPRVDSRLNHMEWTQFQVQQ
ncbi:MAG: hypothetical protein AAF039_16985 [Bacteroidota bacterium]